MTPGGRPRKVGQTRMDAAVDALSPFGFSKGFIRRKVDALLKVYDGEWQFIEDCSYKVLIDTIMEEQDEESMKKKNEAMENEDSASDDAEPSNAHDDTELFDTRDGAELSSAHNGAEPSSDRSGAERSSTGTANEMFNSTWTERGTAKNVNGRDATCVPQAGGRMEWRDISCTDHNFPEDTAFVTTYNEDGRDNGIREPGENGLQGAASLLPPCKHKPCYGWIGSDSGDDEEDFLLLETTTSNRR